MIWHLIKYWASFFIPTFYKRIQGHNVQRLNVKGPVIIAMNHPNAFTDPIAITYVSYPLRVHYMARGDAFKPGIIAWLLEQIGIVPIFRIQDAGKEGLKKNDEAYRRVNSLLKNNAKVIVFAEGLCVQERRLRPLKKGVARMVFGAYDTIQRDDLCVIPVGINYSNPSKFRSSILYNVGEPIAVKDFIPEYREHPARAQKKFLEALEPAMRDLITHINSSEADEVVYFIERLEKENRVRRRGGDYTSLYHQHLVLREITEAVNKAIVAQPALVEEFRTEVRSYFKRLEKNKIKDRLIDPERNKDVSFPFLVLYALLLLIGSPFYLAGLLVNYPALLFNQALTRRLVKLKEFYSSFFIGFSMLTFPLFYAGLFLTVYALAPNVWWALSALVISAVCGGFCLYYHPFLLKTRGIARVLLNRPEAAALAAQRRDLMALVNKF